MSVILQIPPSQTPVLDDQGRMTQPWRTFFNQLINRAGGITGGLQAQSDILDALAALSAVAGFLVQTGATSFTKRTLAGVAGEIAVTNGSGVSGAPTIGLANVAGVAGVHASPTSITVDAKGRVVGIS